MLSRVPQWFPGCQMLYWEGEMAVIWWLFITQVTKVHIIVVGWQFCFQESSSISGWFFSSFCSLWERWLVCLSFKLVTTYICGSNALLGSFLHPDHSLSLSLLLFICSFIGFYEEGQNFVGEIGLLIMLLWQFFGGSCAKTSSLPSYVPLKQKSTRVHYCSLSAKTCLQCQVGTL